MRVSGKCQQLKHVRLSNKTAVSYGRPGVCSIGLQVHTLDLIERKLSQQTGSI